MIKEVVSKIEQYTKLKDIHQYQLILDAARIFIKHVPDGVTNDAELDTGVVLLK